MGKSLRPLAYASLLALFGCAGAKVAANGPNGDGGARDGAALGACDPFSNSGCPSGQKCTALQQGSGKLVLGCDSRGSKSEGNVCVPTMGVTGQTGDDCGDGLSCFSVQGDPAATCHRFCTAANPCPSGSNCTLTVPSLTSLAFCRPACLPLSQSGCASGQGCYSIQDGAVCMPAGSQKPGDTCASPNDCAPGSTCVKDTSGTTCASFCSTATNGTPNCASSPGTTCNPLSGTLPEPNAGVCR